MLIPLGLEGLGMSIGRYQTLRMLTVWAVLLQGPSQTCGG